MSLKIYVVLIDGVEEEDVDMKVDDVDSLLNVSFQKISHFTPFGSPCNKLNTDSSVVYMTSIGMNL